MTDEESEREVYETLIWRGDIIPRSEQEIALAEEGEQFRALLKEAEEINKQLPDPEPDVDALNRWLS